MKQFPFAAKLPSTPISIQTEDHPWASLFRHLGDSYPNYFRFSSQVKDPDIIISCALTIEDLRSFNRNSDNYRRVLLLNLHPKERSGLRSGQFVDNKAFTDDDRRLISEFLIVFTTLDLDPKSFKVVPVPLSFNNYRNVSQAELYWMSRPSKLHHEREDRIDKVYWSGSLKNHDDRVDICSHLAKSNRFVINSWQPLTSSGQHASPYGDAKPRPEEYQTYVDCLLSYQCALQVRGDRKWNFSFLDYLRSSTIPVYVGTGYPLLDWESIGFSDQSAIGVDLGFSEAFSELSADCIEQVLQDGDKIRNMRSCLERFYADFIVSDTLFSRRIYHPWLLGWLDFYAAKIISVFCGQVATNQFFVKEVVYLKEHAKTSSGISRD